jgi:hypothetical protein
MASGFYSDVVGWLYGTTANMNALVHFGFRTIKFSTSNTTLVNTTTNVRSTDNGPHHVGNARLTRTGRFYGPTAEEIGGVCSLRGSGSASMVGGFGGKR